MKDILTALGMAWGNFLWIPSPIKRWDGNLREKMLTMLPFVGAVVGILWFLLALVLGLTPLPAPLTGFLLTLLVYGVADFKGLPRRGLCSNISGALADWNVRNPLESGRA